MKKLIAYDKPAIATLADRLKRANSYSEYQRIQCVLSCATLDRTATQTSPIAGSMPFSVEQYYPI